MFYYNQYIRAKSLEEAYELYQKRQNFIVGGMLWTKMKNTTLGTAIDLCELGLDGIEENENEFRIGAYVSLRDIETNESLNKYTDNAFANSVKDIVGVQFRNVATVGGSIWGRYGFSDVMTIFRALGAKVELFHEGIMELDDFVKLPRTVRDILVSVIVPKETEKVVYLSQRNQSTDFPVLVPFQKEKEVLWLLSGQLHIWLSLYMTVKIYYLYLQMKILKDLQSMWHKISVLAAICVPVPSIER